VIAVPRENAEIKAARLLVSGRVEILYVDDARVVANVRGDTAGVYLVEHDARGWRCDCPARTRCSHLLAVQRVTVRPPRGRVSAVLAGTHVRASG
jgi:uncharacterized Zn finger protein